VDYECLLFHCDEWITKNPRSRNHWTPYRTNNDWAVLLCAAPYIGYRQTWKMSVVTETCLPNRWLAMDSCVYSLLRRRVFGEPLASNWLPLWLHYSGFHNMFAPFSADCQRFRHCSVWYTRSISNRIVSDDQLLAVSNDTILFSCNNKIIIDITS
jgi:hypothetical protein